MATGIRLPTEHFKKIAGMDGARLPAGRTGRYLSENISPGRTLTARRQTEDFDIRRQCPHMERPERRLRSAGDIVVKISEFVVHR